MTLPIPRRLMRWNDVIAKPPEPLPTDVVKVQEDLRLLHAGQAGNRDALATLLSRYEAPLYRLCRGMTATVSDAEDCVQETFLRALRAFAQPGGFRGNASVQTFLYRIALNVCLDAKRRHRPTVSFDGIGETLPSRHAAPEQAAVERATVQSALASLQPRQRLLLVLREQEGFSVSEIATFLNWKPKKVDNELYKMRKALAAWRERSEN